MRTIETTTQNLLFLLAAAPLGMGCIIVTDDTDDTQGGSTSANPNTSGPNDSGDTANPPATGGATGEDTGVATTAEDTATVEETGVVDDTTGGGLDPSVCQVYGEHAYECLIPYSAYATEGCYYNLDYQTNTSAECELAFLEYMACLSQLSCEELTGPEPCFDELDALLALGCPAVE